LANTNAPFGFSQRQGTGSSPTYELTSFRNGGIDYNAGAIYQGDPVNRQSDGTIAQAPGSAGGSTVTMAGVFVSCKYLSTAQKRTIWSNYWPGSDVASTAQSTIEAFVITDPNAQFLAQSDSTGLSQSQVGANLDFNIGTGNASNGISGAFLIHTTQTAAAYPWRLVSLVTDPPGAPGTAQGANATTPAPYNYAVVAFNNVEPKNAVAIT
jgi:hypothetical protein